MRFFISSDIKKNTPLYYAILFFLAFSFLFWIASWIHFYTKYGFSHESLIRYFFMDPELPERISLAQISEDFHVGIFINSLMLITLLSLLNITGWSYPIKLVMIISTSSSMLLYLVSDFLILSTKLVLLKLFSFILYQAFYLLLLILDLIGIVIKREPKTSKGSIIKGIVFLLALLSFFLIFSNFLNFHAKMGFGVQGIKDYLLGNPELFIKRKSFEGVFKVFYPHILSMAIYSLIITHLLPFTSLSRKKSLILGLSIFLFSFLDNLSSLMILYLSPHFVYLKISSFWIFQVCALIASFILLRDSLRKSSYPSL